MTDKLDEERKARRREYYKNVYYPKNRERILAANEKYRQENKEKTNQWTYSRLKKSIAHKARQAVGNAVRAGRLTKPTSCIQCSENKVEAHHYKGYEQEHWLDVMWLCHKHHKEAHGWKSLKA